MSDMTIDLIELAEKPGVLNESYRQRLLEAFRQSLSPRKMSYEEFLAWADEDTYAEWVRGEVIMTSPASNLHQKVSLFLASLLNDFVEADRLGEIRTAPFQMKLEESGREPDVLFMAEEHFDRLKSTYLDGPADLVIEIISPESGQRDRGEKFYEYEAAGIPEYWLIDPQRRQAEFYQLAPAGYYQTVLPEQGVYRSKVLPGFWLRVNWLWQPPRVLEACKELGVV